MKYSFALLNNCRVHDPSRIEVVKTIRNQIYPGSLHKENFKRLALMLLYCGRLALSSYSFCTFYRLHLGYEFQLL